MLKKIIAASFLFALFACSGGDDDSDNNKSSVSGTGNSSSSQDDVSSSSEEKVPSDVAISNFSGESIFGTYVYAYALAANEPEDLIQFWDIENNPECIFEGQDDEPPSECELDKTDAILQNKITNRYADLHYDATRGPMLGGKLSCQLKEYKLSEEGDQASLGLDVGTAPKDIRLINGAIQFSYRYSGGAHVFRAVTANDDSFWFVNVDASASDADTSVVSIEDFLGAGTLEETPFDLSMVKKFLWVVEYDPEAEANNRGSLFVNNFRALVE